MLTVCDDDPISHYEGDTWPLWDFTLEENGVLPDYSTGYTFRYAYERTVGTTLLVVTTGITGLSGGRIQVKFSPALEAANNVTTDGTRDTRYHITFTAHRTSDNTDGATIETTLVLKYRAT